MTGPRHAAAASPGDGSTTLSCRSVAAGADGTRGDAGRSGGARVVGRQRDLHDHRRAVRQLDFVFERGTDQSPCRGRDVGDPALRRVRLVLADNPVRDAAAVGPLERDVEPKRAWPLAAAGGTRSAARSRSFPVSQVALDALDGRAILGGSRRRAARRASDPRSPRSARTPPRSRGCGAGSPAARQAARPPRHRLPSRMPGS